MALRHHFPSEVECRYPGARFRQVERCGAPCRSRCRRRVSCRTVPQQGPHQGLLQNDHGIVLGIVGPRPACVPLPDGYHLGIQLRSRLSQCMPSHRWLRLSHLGQLQVSKPLVPTMTPYPERSSEPCPILTDSGALVENQYRFLILYSSLLTVKDTPYASTRRFPD